MRYILSALLTFGAFVLVTLITNGNHEVLDPQLYLYMIHNFFEDTDSKNAIAAILLNYRMYDTMFEALILLTAIIGMKQFLPRESDMKAGLEKKNHG